MAIVSYKNRATKEIASGKSSKISRQLLPLELHRNALLKLATLDLAKTLGDLGPATGLKLEKLVGDRDGSWSIRINKQYRICFKWNDGDAQDIEIVDYH